MPLPLVPRVRWNAGLRGSPLPGTWGWLSVTYTGKRTGVEGDPLSPDVSLESRLRIDARLAVDLGRRWQVALNVRNLLDSQSTDFLETRVLTGTGTEAWLELTFRPPRTGRASRTGEVP
jgi:outer membrane receptor protein involved in Fe transport